MSKDGKNILLSKYYSGTYGVFDDDLNEVGSGTDVVVKLNESDQ